MILATQETPLCYSYIHYQLFSKNVSKTFMPCQPHVHLYKYSMNIRGITTWNQPTTKILIRIDTILNIYLLVYKYISLYPIKCHLVMVYNVIFSEPGNNFIFRRFTRSKGEEER